jgi:hypothetical protein
MVASQTDLCFTLSARLAAALPRALGLRTLELPFPAPPFAVHSYWHERVQGDAGHRFLRSLVHASIRPELG